MHINGKTQLVAVLGHPIAHTASPAMHNAAFKKLGLNWAYVALDIKPIQLRLILSSLSMAGFVGVNLTVPHKLLAMKCLDKVEREARLLGAANTLRFSKKESRIHGYNTDGYGLLKALHEAFRFSPKNKTIAILGCGGAGQAAAIQLALAGAKKLILINRTRSKARRVATRIKALRLKTKCVFITEPCDLAIQATSLGLHPTDPLPIAIQEWKKLNPPFLFEMIYRPSETKMMRLARKSKSQTVNGMNMLLHQGAKAFEIWTHRKAPLNVMRQALRKELS
jgi:shikimate dehydrogenase